MKYDVEKLRDVARMNVAPDEKEDTFIYTAPELIQTMADDFKMAEDNESFKSFFEDYDLDKITNDRFYLTDSGLQKQDEMKFSDLQNQLETIQLYERQQGLER